VSCQRDVNLLAFDFSRKLAPGHIALEADLIVMNFLLPIGWRGIGAVGVFDRWGRDSCLGYGSTDFVATLAASSGRASGAGFFNGRNKAKTKPRKQHPADDFVNFQRIGSLREPTSTLCKRQDYGSKKTPMDRVSEPVMRPERPPCCSPAISPILL
jgi:hypothetical protein